MNTFTGEKLKSVRKDKGLTQVDIAEVLGLTKQAISRIENGDRSITTAENALLNAFFFGNMPESVTTPPIPSSLVLHWPKEDFRIVQEAAIAANMLVDEWGEKSLLKLAKISAADAIRMIKESEAKDATKRGHAVEADNIVRFIPIPRIPVAAGSPIEGDADTFEAPADLAGQYIAARVFGESMEPEIKDGSTVLLMRADKLRSRMPKKGLVYAVSIDRDTATLKIYNTRKATKKEIDAGSSYESQDGTQKVKVLQSINPAYPEIVLCPEQEPEIIGWYNPEVQP